MGAQSASHVFKNEDLDSCQQIKLAHGQCVVYTRQSPSKHTGNEDAVAVVNLHSRLTALVVADGMGGYECGAQASSIVVSKVSEGLMSHAPSDNLRETINRSLQASCDAIRSEFPTSGSTVTIAIIDNQKVSTCHAGDSEFFVIGLRGEVLGEFVPHSPVGQAMAIGLLDERSAMFHRNRHIISNAIGLMDLNLEFSKQPHSLKKRETIVLGSDGLFDNLYKSEIIDIIKENGNNLLKAGQALVDACTTRMNNLLPSTPHKPDDLSLILFRLRKGLFS